MHPSSSRSFFLSVLCAPLLGLVACSSPVVDLGSPDSTASPDGARPLPALEDAVRVWDTRANQAIELAAMLDRLSEVDVVFVGETHLDDTTHRVEAAVLEGLRVRRGGKVVLSLEMFERDTQPVLDDYLAGRIDEAQFLAAARPWGNYRTDYRPLIEAAKVHGLPVIAANAPAPLRRKLSSGGSEALQALAPEERGLLPQEILPAEASYWERVDRATRGHMNFASLAEEQRLYSGQNLWDNSMGDACAEALVTHPGHTVVHMVGGFHVMYHDGTVTQLRRRAPEARLAVVEVLPAPGLFAARPERDLERADYVVYANELARSVSDGLHALSIPAELLYSIDVPESATDAAPAPLLVWLPDADERPVDARAWLGAALGEEVALAVVEPPYPEGGADLAPGGRWSRSGSFRADQGRLQHGLERLVEYVTRRLPVSAQRVVVAGRGLGGTAVLWSAMYTEWLDARFLAVTPRGAGALRMEGLPDRAPATRGLWVLVAPGEERGLDWVEGDYSGVGTPTELAALGTKAPLAFQVEEALRATLGLAPRPVSTAEPLLCVLERDLPRARQWAEIHARRLERDGQPARVIAASELDGGEDPSRLRRLSIGGEWPLAWFAEGQGLPLAEGDFGGTTVLVVPAGTGPEETEAWLELERTKALRKRSLFAGLRVALEGGEPSLAQVLADLHGAGKRSVLVVPARFCASVGEMRALQDSVASEPAAGELDLAWLPGLGAELCHARPEK